MQVSHAESSSAHIVLGGGEALSFGISDAPEFYTLLSNSLYQYKHLAVVREVICNAYDAHIAAGRRDVPIEVSLDENRLIIRDFGHGIPNDKIIPIYCVYGSSTKTNDENQTGGFGLGSKAPFAYTSHFTVSNHHKGEKTVYAVMRGDEEAGGRPQARKMVCVPTQETGVEVSIPIQKADLLTFEELILKVVRSGGILAKLNGELLERYDYNTDHGLVLPYRTSDLPMPNTICVRYGTVVYPVHAGRGSKEMDAALDKILDLFGRSISPACLIIDMPPNSISVTPSRESLSYTKHTMTSLTKAMTQAHDRILEATIDVQDSILEGVLNEGGGISDLFAAMNSICLTALELFRKEANATKQTASSDIRQIGIFAATNISWWRNYAGSSFGVRQRTRLCVNPVQAKAFKAFASLLHRHFPNDAKRVLLGTRGCLNVAISNYNKLNMRRVSRVFAAANLPTPRLIAHSKGKICRRRRPKSDVNFIEPVITFAPTVGACEDLIQTFVKESAASHLRRNWSSFTYQYPSCLMRSKLKPEALSLANKLGITILLTNKRPQKVKRSPGAVKRLKYRSVKGFKVHYASGLSKPDAPELIKESKHYINAVLRGNNAYLADKSLEDHLPTLLSLYPDLVFASTKEERERLEAESGQDVTKVITKEVRPFLKSKNHLLTNFLRNRWRAPEFTSHKAGTTKLFEMVDLCAKHSGLRMALFGIKGKMLSDDDRFVQLCAVIKKSGSDDQWANKLRKEIDEATQKVFPQFDVKLDDFMERYQYVLKISDRYIRSFSKDATPLFEPDAAAVTELVDLVIFLKDQDKRRQKITILKEAA